MSKIPLAADHYLSPLDPAQDFAQLAHQEGDAVMKRVDLAYQVIEEALLEGRQGHVERACLKLGLPYKAGNAQLTDSAKIYRTLRLGLGLPREQLVGASFGRMRSLAQNPQWTLTNQARAVELLFDLESSEEKIRSTIRGEGGSATAGSSAKWATLEFRQTIQDASFSESVLKGLEKFYTDCGQTFSEDPLTKRGQLLERALSFWAMASTSFTQDGETYDIPHTDYLPGGAANPTPLEPEAETLEDEEAA